MVMAAYSLMPFGLQARVRADVPSPETGMGILVNAGNILWLVLAGWWLALGHLIAAVLNAVTIIGLPFAWAHLKLAGFALQPVGRTLVAR